MNRRILDWPLVNESLRTKIKRKVSKIWAAAPILYFFNARDCGSDFKGYPFFFISRRLIYERSATTIRDRSLAYSFKHTHTHTTPSHQQFHSQLGVKRQDREREKSKANLKLRFAGKQMSSYCGRNHTRWLTCKDCWSCPEGFRTNKITRCSVWLT